MEIVHAPYVIAGHVQSLVNAERQLGLRSKSYSLYPDPYGFKADKTYANSPFSGELYRIKLLNNLIQNSEIIHFNFGTSCTLQKIAHPQNFSPMGISKWMYSRIFGKLELQDLKLFNKLNKKIVVTFQGDDARQITMHNNSFIFQEAKYYSEKSNKLKAKRIKLWEEYASHIYVLNPDLKEYFSRDVEFLPYAISGAATETLDKKAVFESASTFKFAHAPTDFGIKGTRFVLETFRKLREQNLPVELILISGKSNEETRKIISQCHFLIDQLLLGWYGGVAVESMYAGTPVLGFISDQSANNSDSELINELPIIKSSHLDLEKIVKNLIGYSTEEYSNLSLKSIKFANKWHIPKSVATITKNRYLHL